MQNKKDYTDDDSDSVTGVQSESSGGFLKSKLNLR